MEDSYVILNIVLD